MRPMLPLLVLVAIRTGAAVAQPSPAASPGPVPPAAASTSPAPSPAVVVHMTNDTYAPDPVTIHAGDTVRFINDDDVPHTVTADDGSFDSGDMPIGCAWSHTFTKPGTFTYYCVYHTFMDGRITVSAP